MPVSGRGRQGDAVCAAGSNLAAARTSGIAVERTRLTVLAMIGLLCSVAGMLSLAYFGGAVAQLITGDSGPRSITGQLLTRVDQEPVVGALQVSGLAIRGELAPTSFRAEPGEVVGLAGLEGAGHEAVLRVLAGRLAPTSGAVRFPDGSPRARSVAKAVRRGIAYVTGDRRRGLVLDQMVWENVAIVSALGRQDRGIAWNAARFHGVTVDWIDRLSIAGAQPATRVDTLSGGNQQKVLLAAWLATEPQVLLLDDPTRGVDIGAKAQIHRIVAEFAAEGRLVVVTSSDVEELAAICDRIIVFFRGRVRCELSRAELSAHRLLWAMNSPPDGLEAADVRTEDADVPGRRPRDRSARPSSRARVPRRRAYGRL
jgi:ABC-type sugar transport system ATPase subunit